jgi:hypothetical protein
MAPNASRIGRSGPGSLRPPPALLTDESRSGDGTINRRVALWPSPEEQWWTFRPVAHVSQTA